MAMMTKSQAINLANLLGAIRADWDFHGIMAALKRLEGDLGEACIAAITAAKDPQAQTPAAVTNPVYRPNWSSSADEQRAIARRDQLERQRAANIHAEWEQTERQAARLERVRQIRADSRWPVKTGETA